MCLHDDRVDAVRTGDAAQQGPQVLRVSRDRAQLDAMMSGRLHAVMCQAHGRCLHLAEARDAAQRRRLCARVGHRTARWLVPEDAI